MPTMFCPYEPDQLLLMPPTLRDWLLEGHLPHHVSDLVDGPDSRLMTAESARTQTKPLGSGSKSLNSAVEPSYGASSWSTESITSC